MNEDGKNCEKKYTAIRKGKQNERNGREKECKLKGNRNVSKCTMSMRRK